MKNKLTGHQIALCLECALIGLAVGAMVREMLQPGTANGLLWACISAMTSLRCILIMKELKLSDNRALFWLDRFLERQKDVEKLCQDNSKLAARLRDLESVEIDDLK